MRDTSQYRREENSPPPNTTAWESELILLSRAPVSVGRWPRLWVTWFWLAHFRHLARGMGTETLRSPTPTQPTPLERMRLPEHFLPCFMLCTLQTQGVHNKIYLTMQRKHKVEPLCPTNPRFLRFAPWRKKWIRVRVCVELLLADSLPGTPSRVTCG